MEYSPANSLNEASSLAFVVALFLFLSTYSREQAPPSFQPRSFKSSPTVEAIRHCHLSHGDVTLRVDTHCTSAANISLSSPPPPLSRPPLSSHLSPLGFLRIVNADLVCAMRPAWVFISSCRILAASIISHCKAIRVLITRGVHRRGDPSTCLACSAHANSSGAQLSLRHTCRCPAAALYNELIEPRNDSSPAEAALDIF